MAEFGLGIAAHLSFKNFQYTQVSGEVSVDLNTGTNLVTTAGSSIVTSASQTWSTDGATSGDVLEITTGSDIGFYEISSVDSNTQLTLVNDLTTTDTAISYNTYKDINLSTTITPRSASGKILIMVYTPILIQDNNAGSNRTAGGHMVLFKEDTALVEIPIQDFSGDTSSNTKLGFPFTLFHVDSPNTTLPIEYKLILKKDTSASSPALAQHNNKFGNMILLELDGS